jgi:CheY-like chemotaxis protein
VNIRPPESSRGEPKPRILNSWKEIAQYLGRGVRTVQRWELELQLPVRRPRGKSRSAVMALASELDEWVIRTPAYGQNAMAQQPQDPASELRVLVIEDNPNDLRDCVVLLTRVGVKQIDVCSNIGLALLRLENIEIGKAPVPDLVILDLAFALDSGFEVLRYRKAHPGLHSIPVIVWTAMGETERGLCEFLGVRKVVPKWAGPRELEAALRSSQGQAA